MEMTKEQIIAQNNLTITIVCNPANDLDILCSWAVSRIEMTKEQAQEIDAFFGQTTNEEEEKRKAIDSLAQGVIERLSTYEHLTYHNQYLYTCRKLLWLARSYPTQLEDTLREIAQNFNDPYAVFRD